MNVYKRTIILFIFQDALRALHNNCGWINISSLDTTIFDENIVQEKFTNFIKEVEVN